uniref:Cytochrome b n=1 Tax=Protostelium mycophagum TaxID=472931 RepID=A0A290YM03_9EUKA|nr:cytochrome b [Protostelium mycophagum]
MRLLKGTYLGRGLYYAVVNHTTPINLTYAWNFGSLALICLALQIVTGIFLACHYAPSVDLAFDSVEHIMRDVRGGWLVRYMHSNGASMFFMVVYAHILRGLYYGSYLWPRQGAWTLGVILFVLMMATAFLGYVLPWGQMSFWGATVISSLVGAVPLVGGDILIWLWGGYSVGGATLTRFFALHFALPFITLGVAAVHIILVQHFSSNNPLGVACMTDFIPFSPYYLVKDIAGVIPFLGVYLFFVFWAPNYLGHPDNYLRANPLVTPPHIVPEWYFLPFYAILRCCPDKLAGVALMGAGILVLLVLPWLGQPDFKSLKFRPGSRWWLWGWVTVFLGMAHYGALPVDKWTTLVSTNLVGFYFGYFLIFGPLTVQLENLLGRYGRSN